MLAFLSVFECERVMSISCVTVCLLILYKAIEFHWVELLRLCCYGDSWRREEKDDTDTDPLPNGGENNTAPSWMSSTKSSGYIWGSVF